MSPGIHRGRVTTYTYDAMYQRTHIQYDDGSEVHFTYDAEGNKLSVVTDSSQIYHSYDTRSRLIEKTHLIDGSEYSFTFNYDDSGHLISMEYPDNTVIDQTYDDLGRLTDVGNYAHYEFTIDSLIETQTYGNGVITSYTYDVCHRPLSIDVAESYNKEEQWKSTIVLFDKNGNVMWETQIGLIGVNGLSMSPSGLFIGVGATDINKDGHIYLFNGEGKKLWDFQVDGRIEAVAVSENGYVAAAPRDEYIYAFNREGEHIFTHYAGNPYTSQDVATVPDEGYFLFGSQNTKVHSYTLEGELLWIRDVGPVSSIATSHDSEYILLGTSLHTLYLLDREGTILWEKTVTDVFFVDDIAISGHGEYCVWVCRKDHFFPSLPYRSIIHRAYYCGNMKQNTDNFITTVPVILFSERESREIFGSGSGWKKFYEKYPFSQGIMTLSRIAFNSQMNQALIYVTNEAEDSIGGGYFVLLVRDGA